MYLKFFFFGYIYILHIYIYFFISSLSKIAIWSRSHSLFFNYAKITTWNLIKFLDQRLPRSYVYVVRSCLPYNLKNVSRNYFNTSMRKCEYNDKKGNWNSKKFFLNEFSLSIFLLSFMNIGISENEFLEAF